MKIIIRDQPKLYIPSSLDTFISIPPFSNDASKKSQAQLSEKDFPREALADILNSYNTSIGNDQLALQNIDALRAPQSCCIITGQQLGLLGGPLYTILKAITCVALAKKEKAIPVFWAATEDHDLNEVNHTFMLDIRGNIKRLKILLKPADSFVEDLVLAPSQKQKLLHLIKDTNLYSPIIEEGLLETNTTSYAKCMLNLLVKLFAGTGLVFLEPYLLRNMAKPFFLKELANCNEINTILQNTTRRVEEAGGKAEIKISGGTQLFLKSKANRRIRIIRNAKNGFDVGKETYTQQALEQLLENSPMRFSTNVAARPVLQSCLMPVLACVVGPSELAYYRQLGDYYKWHGIGMPWLVPRLSATLIPKKHREMLDKSNLQPWDNIPTSWDLLSNEIGRKINAEKYSGKKAHRKKRNKILLNSLSIPYFALHTLKNLLHPHNKLQERVYNWFTFQAQSEENLIQELLGKINLAENGHYYCFLE